MASAAASGKAIANGEGKPQMQNRYLDGVNERLNRKENAKKKLAAYREEKNRKSQINMSQHAFEQNMMAAGVEGYKPTVQLGDGYQWGALDYV